MNRFISACVFTACLATSPFSVLFGAQTIEARKASMLGDLDLIKHVLDSHYAPLEWKKTHVGLNLDVELAKAKDQVINASALSTKDFQKIVRSFLGKTQDYHVSVLFISTEAATLPFTVSGNQGRYFIDWIDTTHLNSAQFPIKEGDELIQFDGKSVDEVVKDLLDKTGFQSNPQTDQSLAELNLTLRKGEKGDDIPRGPIQVVFKTVAGAIKHFQMIWDYHPEYIPNPEVDPAYAGALNKFSIPFDQPQKLLARRTMYNPIADFFADPFTNLRRRIGAHKSFVPVLGEQIWTEDELPFYSYIYLNEEGKQIGYIRIPDYRSWESDFDKFLTVVEHMQKNTEGLVIDQVNNPGGLVRLQYAILSTLTDRPLMAPRHHLKLTQEDAMEAYFLLQLLEMVKNEEDIEMLFGGTNISSYQRMLFFKECYRFIYNEWKAGHTFSSPIHLEGVDAINPHPTVQYTKPILVLINELDFSGGDFFPAIMQDNKRATLFGAKTAGAGGCVLRLAFPNLHGISMISYTGSLAERIDKQPIESLGVSPDIAYQLTLEDMQYGYQSYAKAVNAAMNQLITPPTTSELSPIIE